MGGNNSGFVDAGFLRGERRIALGRDYLLTDALTQILSGSAVGPPFYRSILDGVAPAFGREPTLPALARALARSQDELCASIDSSSNRSGRCSARLSNVRHVLHTSDSNFFRGM